MHSNLVYFNLFGSLIYICTTDLPITKKTDVTTFTDDVAVLLPKNSTKTIKNIHTKFKYGCKNNDLKPMGVDKRTSLL